jgi:hypothetical protein
LDRETPAINFEPVDRKAIVAISVIKKTDRIDDGYAIGFFRKVFVVSCYQ